MFEKQSSNEHGVSVVISSAGLAGGWDVLSVSVKGRQVPPTRRGEFDTPEEAEEAAYERGAKYLEENFQER